MMVEWRNGWVELRANRYVELSLFAPAESRAVLRAGLEEVVSRLEGALDDKSVLVGTGPWDDPRPPDGSRGYLRR